MNAKRLTISQRLFLIALAISCTAVGTVSFFYDREAEAAILQRSFDQLASVRTLKQSKVEEYFASLSSMLSVLASHPASILTSAHEMHLRYNVLNIMILSPKGKIVYAHQDSTLLGSTLPDSVWGAVQRSITHSHQSTTVHFTDFIHFRGDIAAFGIVRIVDDDNDKNSHLLKEIAHLSQQEYKSIRGYSILIQLSLQELNGIMIERAGLGQTGESYIVGDDYRTRTDLRFLPPPAALRYFVRTEPVRQALSGNTNLLETRDYRNVDVISAFAPLRIDALRWAIVSEFDVEEITIPIAAARGRIIVLGLAITLLMAGISWQAARTMSEPILRLQNHLTAIAKGRLPENPLLVERRDEIGTMTEALNSMTISLRQATLFARDIGAGKFDAEFMPRSDSDMLVIALNDMKKELQRLLLDKQSRALQSTLALVEGEEQERARLARDVHDGIGQILTALRFNLARVPDVQMRSELFDLLDDAIVEVRAISHNLMPGVLVDFGLSAALEHLCRTISKAAQIEIWREIVALPTRIQAPREIAIYRIAQEAFNNVLRHANATIITLILHITDDNTALQLDIHDNGIGFDMNTYGQGNGLTNMRERAALFGGEVYITSKLGVGTRIVLTIPIA